MTVMNFNLLDRFRKPEYTGENRCVPCTVLNLLIAAAASSIIAVFSAPFGIAAFVVSVGVIHLRGYLIPGTPTITSRYFPDRVLRLFDKGTAESGEGIEDYHVSVDVENILVDAGVIEACEDVDDLCLTDGFRSSWDRRIESVREEGREKQKRLLAESVEVSPDGIEFDQGGEKLAVRLDGDRIASWVSPAAFLSDLTAEKELEIWCDGWDSMDGRSRSQAIASLRVFLEECPSCGGPVSPVEENVDTCCRKNLVNVTLKCEDCGDVVFEGSYR